MHPCPLSPMLQNWGQGRQLGSDVGQGSIHVDAHTDMLRHTYRHRYTWGDSGHVSSHMHPLACEVTQARTHRHTSVGTHLSSDAPSVGSAPPGPRAGGWTGLGGRER